MILYILIRFFYGFNYYKRLKTWNEVNLNFFIIYFIKTELGHYDIDLPQEYFKLYEKDELEKQLFSKNFAGFVKK